MHRHDTILTRRRGLLPMLALVIIAAGCPRDTSEDSPPPPVERQGAGAKIFDHHSDEHHRWWRLWVADDPARDAVCLRMTLFNADVYRRGLECWRYESLGGATSVRTLRKETTVTVIDPGGARLRIENEPLGLLCYTSYGDMSCVARAP